MVDVGPKNPDLSLVFDKSPQMRMGTLGRDVLSLDASWCVGEMAPADQCRQTDHQRRTLMNLILIILVVVLLFGGGGYWGRGRGYW